jgi:N-glycosidase YbiA
MSYWGASLENEFTHITSNFPNLNALYEIHSTLLYLSPKNKKFESHFLKLENKPCTITLLGYGYNANYVALDVKEVYCENVVPFYGKKQHVTLAIKDGKLSKNSITCFTNKTSKYVTFEEPLIVNGTIVKIDKSLSSPPITSPTPQSLTLNETDTILFYDQKAKYGEFSNFYHIDIEYKGIKYLNSETYFQAEKFKGSKSTIDDCNYALIIEEQNTPNKAAVLARQKPPNQPYAWAKELKLIIDQHPNATIRADWENIKDLVMRRIVYIKFTLIKNKLLETKDKKLVEHTTKDAYWGDGYGNGLNKLGKILEETRYLLGGQLSDRYASMLVFDYSHWVIPGLLLASGAPNDEIHLKMIDCGFKCFISLMEAFQEREKGTSYHHYVGDEDFTIVKNDITYNRFSIVDRKVATDEKALKIAKFVLSNIGKGIPTVIQCLGGKGRTGNIAGIVIGLLYDVDGDTALKMTNTLYKNRKNPGTRCNKSPQTNVQFAQVRRIVDNHTYQHFE